MKKILILDDSALMRRVMSDIINSTSVYQVAYVAKNGVEGLEIIINHNDIDVVVTDIEMPKMSGLELLGQLKNRGIDIPVLVVSSLDDKASTVKALELGAVDFIKKPEHIRLDNNHDFSDKVQNALKAAVESRKTKQAAMIKSKVPTKSLIRVNKNSVKKNAKRLIALVCSTGGPRALQSVIPKLPQNIAAPMVLVQHMPKGFTATLASRLDSMSEVSVKEAEAGDQLKNGVVYIAKGGTHLIVNPSGKGGFTGELDEAPVGGLKPCGDLMLKSLSELAYDEIICVVLTGMGADGTKGIKELSEKKNIYVIAQDEQSSTVYGMPRAIYQAGLCDVVCDLDDIAEEIIKKVGVL